jgi:hypothetical protein
MEEINTSRLEPQRGSLEFVFPFIKYIFGIWDLGSCNPNLI